jgi:hypothetical protein
MNTTAQHICPLCFESAALLGTANYTKYKVFGCKGCGSFAVTDLADERIRGLPAEFKDAWRAKVRATKPDDLFVIMVGPVGSGSRIEELRIPRHTIRPLS